MYEIIRNGKRKKIKGQIEEQWGTMTHEDFAEMEIKHEKLASLLQEYGDSKDDTEQFYRRFLD